MYMGIARDTPSNNTLPDRKLTWNEISSSNHPGYSFKVLRMLADTLDKERRKKRHKAKEESKFVICVRAGEKATSTKTARGILPQADDWEMRADLDKKLVFP